MKKIVIFILLAIVVMIVDIFLINKSSVDKDFISQNIEALTDDDESGGIQFRCRCHDDGVCYGGNAISLRPLCYSETAHSDGVVECSFYSSYCN